MNAAIIFFGAWTLLGGLLIIFPTRIPMRGVVNWSPDQRTLVNRIAGVVMVVIGVLFLAVLSGR